MSKRFKAFQNRDPEGENYRSRADIKRELEAIDQLGRELAQTATSKLKKLPLSEHALEAIQDAAGMSKGAQQRQFRYLRNVLESEDIDAIREKLEELNRPSAVHNARFHAIESYRDRLLAGEDQIYDELFSLFGDYDRQHIRGLVRNAQSEAKQDKPPKSARQLFKYLRELQDGSL